MKDVEKQYIDEFNEKYTTDVQFEDIINDEAFQERLHAANSYKDLYKRKLKNVIKKITIAFSALVACFVLVIVMIAYNPINLGNNHDISIEKLLNNQEMDIFLSDGALQKENITLLSQEGCYNIYIFSSYTVDKSAKNNKIYTFYYKAILNNDKKNLVLSINDNEYIINNNNSFGSFNTISKLENEVLTLIFSLEYDGVTRNYQIEQ